MGACVCVCVNSDAYKMEGFNQDEIIDASHGIEIELDTYKNTLTFRSDFTSCTSVCICILVSDDVMLP